MHKWDRLAAICSVLLILALSGRSARATFSIVAVDPDTGEVGGAGATCIQDILVIIDTVEGKGAIHTQALWNPDNQALALERMLAGDSPQEILDFVVANDVEGRAGVRQYGAVDIFEGGGRSAAFTGANTIDYKGHITGPTYAIQGNIILGPEILTNMEAAFLASGGDLADRLMAALEAANVPGADNRCLPDKPALSAFIKVVRPGDGDYPSIELHIPDTSPGANPINLLRQRFDAPRARFDFTPKTGLEQVEVQMDASGSVPGKGATLVRYRWDFGDGGTDEGPAVAHNFTRPGFYTIALEVTDALGATARTERAVTVFLSPGDLAPWSSVDIGNTGAEGSGRSESAGLLLFAGGKTFGGNADNFHFVHQEFTGDTTITARVKALSPVDAISSVGLMLRGSLEQNSRHASILFSQTGSRHHMDFVRRRGLLTQKTSSGNLPDRWIRIERQGNEFIGYHSDNGIFWTELGRQAIDMPAMIFGGIAVTAENGSENDIVFAQIANLYIGAPPAPRYIRGDGNGDGRVNIADPSYIAGTIFDLSVAPITCEAATDANGDGRVNIADPTYIANFLFGIGPAAAPPAPFPDCALVPPEEPLGCLGTEGCFE